MPYTTIFRGCGSAAILGGVLFLVWGYLHRSGAPAYLTNIANTLGFVVPLLFLLGLAGLCAWGKGGVGRLGMAGLGLGLIGSVEGVVRSVMDMSAWYSYVAGKSWLHLVLNWLFLLLSGLTLAGIGALWAGASRRLGVLLLAMGALGGIYCVTDSGRALEMRTVHVVFGVLFGLIWVALGYALWSEGTHMARGTGRSPLAFSARRDSLS